MPSACGFFDSSPTSTCAVPSTAQVVRRPKTSALSGELARQTGWSPSALVAVVRPWTGSKFAQSLATSTFSSVHGASHLSAHFRDWEKLVAIGLHRRSGSPTDTHRLRPIRTASVGRGPRSRRRDLPRCDREPEREADRSAGLAGPPRSATGSWYSIVSSAAAAAFPSCEKALRIAAPAVPLKSTTSALPGAHCGSFTTSCTTVLKSGVAWSAPAAPVVHGLVRSHCTALAVLGSAARLAGAVLKGPALAVASPVMRTVSAPSVDPGAAVNCTLAAKIWAPFGIWTSGKRRPTNRPFWKSRSGLLRRIVPSSCCSASSALADTRSERWRSPGPQLQEHTYELGSTGFVGSEWKPQPVVDSKINGNAMTATRAVHIFIFTIDLLMNCCELAVPRTRVVDDERPYTTEAPRHRREYTDNQSRRVMDWTLPMTARPSSVV